MGALIFPTVLLLLGLFWMYKERDMLRHGLRSYRWQRTEGRIIDTEDRTFLTPGVGRSGTSVGLAEYRETGYFYEYQVGRTRYVNDSDCFGSHVDKQTGRYLVGERVSVFYDPRDPSKSVLRRGLSVGIMAWTIPVVVGLVALIWILCT